MINKINLSKSFFLFVLLSTSAVLNGQFKSISSDTKVKQDISKIELDKNSLIKQSKDIISTEYESVDYFEIPFEVSSPITVVARNEQGKAVAFEGSLDLKARSNKDLRAQFYKIVEMMSEEIGISDPSQELQEISRTQDDLGISHIKFVQTFKGVKVYGSEILAHGDREKINYINGSWYNTPKIESTLPKLSQVQTFNMLSKNLAFKVRDPRHKLFTHEPSSELVIYVDKSKRAHLAYHHIAFPDNLHRWEYFVDANSGSIIHQFMNTCKLHNHDISNFHKKMIESDIKANMEDNVELGERTTFADGHVVLSGQDLLGVNRSVNSLEKTGKRYMIDINRDMFVKTSLLPNDPEGTIWTIDAFGTSPQNDNFKYDHVVTTAASWNNPAAVSSQYNAALAFEYIRNIHKRNSINGSGGNIISLINVAEEDGKSMENAFWNGAAMFYGNGGTGFFPLARGLDVAGHEMFHGVIQNSANLEYEGESGALNESFADVFGAMIDRNDWLIGEDVVKRAVFPSGALRSLSDPHNGASKDNYAAGFQPKLYSERYIGTQDNGGVHINSGIPNFAFFLFASNATVGKDKAEQVYYRALTTYLTKSSKFIDCKYAVVKSAKDIYGDAIAKIAEDAWNAVGVTGAVGTVDPKDKYQNDINKNPGKEYILVSNGDGTNLYTADVASGQFIFNPLSETDPVSRPSITDDGTEILFVGKDKKIHYIQINYTNRTKQEEILLKDFDFRNAVISRDGRLLALLTAELQPTIIVIDASNSNSSEASKLIQLRNPTTASNGASTGDVKYADAMEFNHTGEYLMYDAENVIKSPTAGEISYWDISFMKIFDKKTNKLLDVSNVQFSKLFNGLPENISVGNPTFSENSPYIIAFDYLDEKSKEYKVLGANTETGKVDLIANVRDIGVPCYSVDDKSVLYNNQTILSGHNINIVTLDASKFKSVNPAGKEFIPDSKTAIWFANGKRVLSDNEDVNIQSNLQLLPNPVIDEMHIHFENTEQASIEILDAQGRSIRKVVSFESGSKIRVADLSTGIYTIRVTTPKGVLATSKFVKL